MAFLQILQEFGKFNWKITRKVGRYNLMITLDLKTCITIFT